ncbi:MAG TPA: prephenate dehydrogenase/arogenate dehydrogenase family protein [Candidatus Acidoferrum sp.]|jgi:prephenate dehydrogenase
MSSHLIQRVTVLGTGLIGGSFALALRKNLSAIRVSGWDRPEVVRDAKVRSAFEETFSGDLAAPLAQADLIYIALPIGVTIDLLPEIASHAQPTALVTDACSTKRRITEEAAQHFPGSASSTAGPIFLGGHPMAGKELSGIAAADPELFRGHAYALIAEGDVIAAPTANEPRIAAFVKILEKIGAEPLWIGAQQHDYAVGLASHLPQLAAVALASFLYDRLDENGLPITLAGPGLRDSLRLAGSPYSTWRDIILTNKELLSASLDLFARRLDDLRERLASRNLEADFDSANELYKLLHSI